MKSPAFQLYVNDFLGSAKVGMMSAEEIGAYILLLFLDWQEGGFVYEPTGLAKWCRLSPAKFRRAWAQVGKCFVERDGRLWNPRLDVERQKQAEWRDKAAKGAATTNAKRWRKDRSSDGVAKGEPSLGGRTPFPSPTQVTTSSSSPDVARLLDGLPNDTVRLTWAAEIDGARQGMHGPILTDEQVDRACRDYVGNGHLTSPTLRHFRAFLESVGRPPTIRPVTSRTRPGKVEAGLVHLQNFVNAGTNDGE